MMLRWTARALAVATLAGACLVLEACHRQVAVDASLMGHWSVQYHGGDGIAYSGVLDVARSTGAGLYSGTLQLGFRGPRRLADTLVMEDAQITVQGSQVTVNCTKPVVLTEDSEYVPDNFVLRRLRQNVLKGYERDILSINGTVILTKE